MTGSAATVPLNRLDEFFLGLDHDEQPWNVHVEARMADRLEPERLADAICTAARRHPIARARLAAWRYTDREYRWEIADTIPHAPLEVVECGDDAALGAARENLLSLSPSLEAAPPFAALLAQGPGDGDSIVLNVNHAAADGIGALRLLRSILRAYAGEDDPIPPLDPLAVRDVRALAGSSSVMDGMVRMRALARNALSQWQPPTRLATAGAGGAGYGAELFVLSPEETEAVRGRRTDGATVNDVMLAALVVAIRRWNAEHGRRARRVTLSMPVNLRPREWKCEIVGNFASYVSVGGGVADDLRTTVQVISRQTRAIKRDGLAGLVVDLLAGPSRMTIAAKRRLPELIPLTGDLVVDTASLANLGAIEPLGDDVEAVWFSPPGRMPLGAAIGVAGHLDRLHIALRHRRAQFDAPAASRFAGLFREVLLEG